MVSIQKVFFSVVIFSVSFVVNPAVGFTQESDSLTGKIHRNYKPEVGKPHPDFVLPSIEDGKQIQLSDFRGKKVLLLHFASW